MINLFLLLAALRLLMLCINGMNMTNSCLGRFFMSSIVNRDPAGFSRYAWLFFVAVFANSTLVGDGENDPSSLLTFQIHEHQQHFEEPFSIHRFKPRRHFFPTQFQRLYPPDQLR